VTDAALVHFKESKETKTINNNKTALLQYQTETMMFYPVEITQNYVYAPCPWMMREKD